MAMGAARASSSLTRREQARMHVRRALRDEPHGPLPALLLALTVLAGVVDAVSILSLGGVFVATMTGNLVARLIFGGSERPGGRAAR